MQGVITISVPVYSIALFQQCTLLQCRTSKPVYKMMMIVYKSAAIVSFSKPLHSSALHSLCASLAFVLCF